MGHERGLVDEVNSLKKEDTARFVFAMLRSFPQSSPDRDTMGQTWAVMCYSKYLILVGTGSPVPGCRRDSHENVRLGRFHFSHVIISLMLNTPNYGRVSCVEYCIGVWFVSHVPLTARHYSLTDVLHMSSWRCIALLYYCYARDISELDCTICILWSGWGLHHFIINPHPHQCSFSHHRYRYVGRLSH